MRIALSGWLLTLLAVGVAAQALPTAIERPFDAGGRITMDLSAGEYEISGSADNRIRLDWDADDGDDVDNRVTIKGTEARVATDGPGNHFRVRIQVPARSNLYVRLTAGELTIKGIEGDKDVELHAGELDIDVVRADDYNHVDAKIWAGQLHASAFRVTKEGLFRSFDWNGNGKYRLHAHLKAGEMRLHAANATR